MPLPSSPIHPRLARGEEIQRRHGLSVEQFNAEHAVPHKPVILTDLMADWAALGKWTPESLGERFPDRIVKFKYGGLEMRMADFIPQVLASSVESPAPYLTNLPIDEYFPELANEIQPLPAMFEPNWAKNKFVHPGLNSTLRRGAMIELYLGGPGGKFPILHWDGLSTHAWLMQLHGVKQYWVWPPEDSEYMYPGDPYNLSPIRDVENPDLETWPLFAKARATTFTLHPGEMLFVPSRWWHTAKMLSPSITLSINTLNDTNWQNFVKDLTHKKTGIATLLKKIYLGMERSRFRR